MADPRRKTKHALDALVGRNRFQIPWLNRRLGSNFSSARTLRQRVELNNEAVARAGNLANRRSALVSPPLRTRLSEESACAQLLQPSQCLGVRLLRMQQALILSHGDKRSN